MFKLQTGRGKWTVDEELENNCQRQLAMHNLYEENEEEQDENNFICVRVGNKNQHFLTYI